MKLLVLGLFLLLPLTTGARSPTSDELFSIYANTGAGLSTIKATTTGEIHYVTGYGSPSGLKLYCDGQIIQAVQYFGSYVTPVKCAGSLQENGDGEINVTGYTMSSTEYDESATSQGTSSICTDDTTNVCYSDWIFVNAILIGLLGFLGIGYLMSPLK